MKTGKYKHFKGNVYEVIAVGKHSESFEELVVYRNSDGQVWIRPKDMFLEDVEVDGEKVPRFAFLE